MTITNNVKHPERKTAYFGMRLRQRTLEDLQNAAAADGRSVSDFAARLIERHLGMLTPDRRPLA